MVSEEVPTFAPAFRNGAEAPPDRILSGTVRSRFQSGFILTGITLETSERFDEFENFFAKNFAVSKIGCNFATFFGDTESDF